MILFLGIGDRCYRRSDTDPQRGSVGDRTTDPRSPPLGGDRGDRGIAEGIQRVNRDEMTSRSCKDCPPGSRRQLKHPGPRCTTHHRAVLKLRRARAHELMVARTYGLHAGEYEAMYTSQGGVCAICQRANGRTRRLSVDHDHSTGRVRGLLCRPCNDMLGHCRDSVDMLSRAVAYLR